MASPAESYFHRHPPEVSGKHKVVTKATTNANAVAWDWVTDVFGSLEAAPKVWMWIKLQASGNHCHVRFSPVTSATTTLTNGLHINNNSDAPDMFYVHPELHTFIDVIAQTGAGSLEVQVSSGC